MSQSVSDICLIGIAYCKFCLGNALSKLLSCAGNVRYQPRLLSPILHVHGLLIWGLYWTTHKNLGYIMGYSMIIGCLRNRNKKVREESILAAVETTLDEDTLPLKKKRILLIQPKAFLGGGQNLKAVIW